MSLLVWIHATDCVLHLNQLISHHVEYPTRLHLIFGGKALQDPKPLMDNNILPVSTIILNLRRRGGAEDYSKTNYMGGGIGSISIKNTETHQKHKNGGLSFKNILQGKNTPSIKTKQVGTKPSPYIVEQLNCTPEFHIDIPETDENCNKYEKQVIICRFNCFWPKPVELFHWIFTN